jgi:indole-3-glycerol phosphate synthase
VVLVGESGVSEVADVERLAAAGADAVLVGEALMRAADAAALMGALGGVRRWGR